MTRAGAASDFLQDSASKLFAVLASCSDGSEVVGHGSEFSGEGLVQQRLLQRLQRGELPLVEAGEPETDRLGLGAGHALDKAQEGLSIGQVGEALLAIGGTGDSLSPVDCLPWQAALSACSSIFWPSENPAAA